MCGYYSQDIKVASSLNKHKIALDECLMYKGKKSQAIFKEDPNTIFKKKNLKFF